MEAKWFHTYTQANSEHDSVTVQNHPKETFVLEFISFGGMGATVVPSHAIIRSTQKTWEMPTVDDGLSTGVERDQGMSYSLNVSGLLTIQQCRKEKCGWISHIAGRSTQTV